MISYTVSKYFFLFDTWIPSWLGTGSSGYAVLCVCWHYFTVLSLPILHNRTPNTSKFSLCKESVFSPVLLRFSRVLSILEACRICQVCVFSHQNSLELSKPSQSVDADLFSSQINYLLLFNYCLSSICSVLSFWYAYHFYYGFPGSVLQFLSYTSALPSPYIFALDCPGSEFALQGDRLFLQISY